MRNYIRLPRVYSTRRYQNPLFTRRRKKIRRISIKTKLIILAALLAAGGLVWLLPFNSYFFIDNVVVRGGERIDDYRVYNIIDRQLQKKRLFVFSQQNIFTLSKRQLTREILSSFRVNDLRINKDLPRSLTVSFHEETPAAVWAEQERYYYVDSDLNVLAEVEGLQVDASEFSILRNETDRALIRQSGLGKRVSVGSEYLLAVLTLAQHAGAGEVSVTNTFDINEPEQTVRMQLQDGPAVYFNVENDLQAQMNKLTVLLDEQINQNELQKLDYIDLRFGDKVYYK